VFPVRNDLDFYTVQMFTSSRRGCYIRPMTARVQLKKKISGREPHGAWRPHELIGGKPPVVK
jgi:hypothetical protein